MDEKSTSAAKPEKTGAKTLKVFDSLKGENRLLELMCDPLRLLAFLRISTTVEKAAPSLDDANSFLRDHDLTLDDKAQDTLKKLIEAAAGEGVFGPVIVARGKMPVNGEDSRIKWFFRKPNTPMAQSVKGARIDHKERNALVNIGKGQKILTITEATEGTPGADVFGSEIPCRPGQAIDMKRGKNIDLAQDGRTFVSTCPGYLDIAGNTVSVEPVLNVKGDVDLSVGNIDFVGPVKVSGDIIDGFHVKTPEEIEVSGMVEGAFLESGKHITVTGGVAGKTKGTVVCKGPLEARYLSEVYVETGGDIKVQNSIVNATVKSRGRVDVLSGGIKGANIVARNGVRAPEIGSELGVRTIIVVGMDYDLKDRLVTLEREVAVLKQTMYKIEAALGPLLANTEMISRLDPAKAEVAKKLMAQRDTLRAHQKRLSAGRDDVLTRMQVNEGVWVEADKMIFPGVVMQIGTCRRTFETEVVGPVKLSPDFETGSINVHR